MNGKKLVIAGLSAALVLGVAVEAFAAPRHGERMSPEATYVRMLKMYDANKDGRITPEEAKVGADGLFTKIDTNTDGSITPGEMRAYGKEQRDLRRAERQKMRAERETAENAQAGSGDGDKDGMKPRHHKDRDGKDGHGMKGHGGGAMMFRIADKDENGQVSKQEASAAADRIFQRMDRNKDGVISIDDMPNR